MGVKRHKMQDRLLWDARGWDFKRDHSKPEPGENNWGHDEGQGRVLEGPSHGWAGHEEWLPDLDLETQVLDRYKWVTRRATDQDDERGGRVEPGGRSHREGENYIGAQEKTLQNVSHGYLWGQRGLWVAPIFSLYFPIFPLSFLQISFLKNLQWLGLHTSSAGRAGAGGDVWSLIGELRSHVNSGWSKNKWIYKQDKQKGKS